MLDAQLPYAWMTRRGYLPRRTLGRAVPQQSRLQVVPALLGTDIADTTDGGPFVYGSHTLTAGQMALLFLAITGTTPDDPNSIVDSRGITWTLVPGGTAVTTTRRASLYYAVPAIGQGGAGTITMGVEAGDAITGLSAAVIDCVGAATSGGLVAAGIEKVTAGSAGASNGQTITLSGTIEHVNNVHIYGIMHTSNEATTVGTGFTQLSDRGRATPGVGFETAYKVNDLTADVTWATSAISAWVGVEVKAA